MSNALSSFYPKITTDNDFAAKVSQPLLHQNGNIAQVLAYWDFHVKNKVFIWVRS